MSQLVERGSTEAIPAGLSSAEAAARRVSFGANEVAEDQPHPAMRILRQFWSPVPWMLEATILVQLVVGERLGAAMITLLLLLNVGLGVVQEGRANAALALLKQRLVLRVRARRDGAWADLSAAELVPNDIVQLSLGTVVPADLALLSGSVLLDQSMLTGESVPSEAGAGAVAYAGALVRRGEAVGEVTATGARTYFGRAAELVRVAHVESAEQKTVLGVVRNLSVVNFAIVVGLVLYAHFVVGMAVGQIIPLVVAALLSAVPAALPATFTLAAALGARGLALKGVLLTRLSALHEAAMIDVLCVDKTGTLTENALAISAVHPLRAGMVAADVLAHAALASSSDGQDPMDAAIRAAASRQQELAATALRFTPFDPVAKMAAAEVVIGGRAIRVVKGAPSVIGALAPMPEAATAALDGFAHAGNRVIAIAAGPEGALAMIGLIAFADPPRADSAPLLAELLELGVHPVMVTGDSATTAATIAGMIGLRGPVCPPGAIPDTIRAGEYAVFAGVFPEQKYHLVEAFQREGHGVGMCGDGANDAPALRQAQMGIAVSTATDVAKAAAGIVLTEPGLAGIVTCIKEGRSAFQRVMTYTLTILVNKCATLVVMGAGLVMTGHAVLTPTLQALSMLAGDFMTMSRAGDRSRPTPYPNAWRVRNLTLAAIPLGATKLAYCTLVLAFGWFVLHLTPTQMQTLTFMMLLYAGQANNLSLRERGRFWHSRPARPVLIASGLNLVAGTCLAGFGILMDALPLSLLGWLFLANIGFIFTIDTVKLAVLDRLPIDRVS